MNTKTPIFKQTAWISAIPQLIVMAIFILTWRATGQKDFILYGAISYLAVSFSLRWIIPIDHRRGISHVRKQEFEAAIPHFQKSYDFFKEKEWIDKNRYLTLLSSSKMSYREMALINLAFCYGQVGNGTKSLETYHQTLNEFPDCIMAQQAIKLLSSVKNEN